MKKTKTKKRLSVSKEAYALKNRKIAEKFLEDCYAEGLQKKRIDKYRYQLKKISDLLGKSFEEATKEDIKRMIAEIERSNYKDWTKHDFKVAIKRFWKWLKKTEDIYPDEVRWIRTTLKNRYSRLPEDLLTQEEVKKMIEAADNIRDKALIAVLYESGCRAGELLNMRFKDVSFDEPTCSIKLHGKTGDRRVLLVSSTPYLANWIAHAPNKGDPNAPVWVSIGTRNHWRPLKYNSLRERLKAVARKAGIKKQVNPHNFRHSRATHLANKLTEAQMCAYLGWAQGSDMPRVYVHLSGRDVDSAILEMHGLKKKEESREESLKFKECPICGKANEFEAKICVRCARPLDLQSALEIREKEKRILRMLTPEIIDELIKARLSELLSETKASETKDRKAPEKERREIQVNEAQTACQ